MNCVGILFKSDSSIVDNKFGHRRVYMNAGTRMNYCAVMKRKFYIISIFQINIFKIRTWVLFNQKIYNINILHNNIV